MMIFGDKTQEDHFRAFFAQQHVKWDNFVTLLGWMQYPAVLVGLWRNGAIRSPLWHVAFLLLYTLEKVIPTVALTVCNRAYLHHRTAVQMVVRLLKIYTSDAYLSLWMDFSNKGSFSEWTLLLALFGNNWLALANWGLLHPMASTCWLPIQVGHLALLFLRQPASMRQMEGGLHHLAPLTAAVNAAAGKLGSVAVSERDVMFSIWMVLQVFAGFLAPWYLTYMMQLRSRRLWRQGVLKRLAESPRSNGGDRGDPLPLQDPGLNILPTWTLLLPQSAVILILSFVAGRDFKLLQYMV